MLHKNRVSSQLKALVLAMALAVAPTGIAHAADPAPQFASINVGPGCVSTLSIEGVSGSTITVDYGATLTLTITNTNSIVTQQFSTVGTPFRAVRPISDETFTIGPVTSALSALAYPVPSDSSDPDNNCPSNAQPPVTQTGSHLYITPRPKPPAPTVSTTSNSQSVAATQGTTPAPTPPAPTPTTTTTSSSAKKPVSKPADTITTVLDKPAAAKAHPPYWLIPILVIIFGLALWSIWSDKVLFKKLLEKIKSFHLKPIKKP